MSIRALAFSKKLKSVDLLENDFGRPKRARLHAASRFDQVNFVTAQDNKSFTSKLVLFAGDNSHKSPSVSRGTVHHCPASIIAIIAHSAAQARPFFMIL